MGWRLWQSSPKGKGYKIFHTSLIIILYKGKKGIFFGDAQPHEYWLQHTEVPEGHSSMTCIALLWDPLLLRLLKGIFHFYPFLPLSTPSQCCTLPPAPIPTLSPQWASSVLILWELQWGWSGIQESYPYVRYLTAPGATPACAQD